MKKLYKDKNHQMLGSIYFYRIGGITAEKRRFLAVF